MKLHLSVLSILIIAALTFGCIQQKDVQNNMVISYSNIEKHITELASDKWR